MKTMRRALVGLSIASALAAGAAALPASAATGNAAAGRDIVIGPADDVKAALESLQPGDQLRLQPGTYDVTGPAGTGIHPTLRPGTATSRILVTAVDGANPPLLNGYVVLDGADYWTLQYLRFQATVPTKSAVAMTGGTGWTLHKDEFFGASTTGSYANVSINNDSDTVTPPQHWSFVDNCVHGAGAGTLTGHTDSTDHNLYVGAVGNAPGLVARNMMMNAPAGSNIKVGSGGPTAADPHPVGASNVHVEYNTLFNANEHILVVGHLAGIDVSHNLDLRATFVNHPRASIRLETLDVSHAVTLAQNYNYTAPDTVNPPVGLYVNASPTSTYVDDGSNGLRTADPALSNLTCDSYSLANSTVYKTYGRFADRAGTPVVP
jgi:hypothetical protein